MSNRKYPVWVATKTHQRMHDDFKIFLWWLWRKLGLPDPTARQYEIADYLQNGPKRRIVMAFRGIGKSWITAAFVLWCLMRNPEEKIMVVSASEYKALEFSTFTKQLIETIPLLGWLKADTKRGQRDSVLAFDVGPARPAQAPSVRAVGINGQMTGGRASKVVFDDIEIPNNSETEGKREKLELRSREMGGAILMPKIGEVIGLGTPQSVQTVYNDFGERGYEFRIWPARYPEEKDIPSYAGRLAPSILERLADDSSVVGRPTDPDRFDEEDLTEREAEYGRSGFSLQFMLDTTLSDANKYPLKLRDLIVHPVDEELAPRRLVWASGPQQEIAEVPNVGLNGDRYHRPAFVSEDEYDPYENRVMFIDPSGRGKDETSYCVAYGLHGRVFVKRWSGFSGGYDTSTLRSLAMVAKEHKVNEIWIEENFGDGMFTALFKPILVDIHKCHVEEYRVTGQKELRIIDKLEPILNQHRVVVDQKIVEEQNQELPEDAGERAKYYNGFFQLSHLTKDRGSLKHDDRVEILAECVGWFTQSVERDSEKSAEKKRQRLIDEELQKFMKAAKALRGTDTRRRFTDA